MSKLEAILGLDKLRSYNQADELYSFLPISTSLQQQLKHTSNKVFQDNYEFSQANIEKLNKQKNKPRWDDLIPNVEVQSVKDDLVMLKLRNMIDHTKFSKTEEMRKIPKKVQKGVVIEGDGFEMKKIQGKKKYNDVVEQFLELDQEKGYTTRKFAELQKVKQRRRKITKKSLMMKKGGKKSGAKKGRQ